MSGLGVSQCLSLAQRLLSSKLEKKSLMAIVVNADDFGLSQAVNDAVLQAFVQGWISSATILANMPCFDPAVELVHGHKLAGKVGVHLNLSQGRPLTEAIRRCPRLCTSDGELRGKARNLYFVSSDECKAIKEEFRAQIVACRKRGFEPSHLDSHHQVHASWAIGGITIEIAKELGIRFIRLAHNAGSGISWTHKIYSNFFNQRLRFRGMAGVCFFCELPFVTPKLLDAGGGIEIMVHPIMNAAGEVLDSERGDALGSAIGSRLRGRICSSYGELAAR